MRSSISLTAAALLFTVTVVVNLAAQGGGPPQQGRGARPPFPAQQRPPGDPALIARGNGLYGVHCQARHGVDLRGGDQGGPNLLRSDTVLDDQAGELIAPVIMNGQQAMPPIRVPADDARAIAEGHSQRDRNDARPGNSLAGPPPALNVVVGDAAAGEAYFKTQCGTCHSGTRSLQGIGLRLSDPTALQNFWIPAGGELARGGRGGRPRPVPVTVTPGTGQKVEGTLVRLDDFYVVVELADGTPRTFRRSGDQPIVDAPRSVGYLCQVALDGTPTTIFTT